MAHFYADAQGRGDTLSGKTGTKKTGIKAHVRGWNVGARVVIDHINGQDVVRVYKTKGSNNPNDDELIATIDESSCVVRVPS